MMHLEMACATDIGLQRDTNQDCVALRPALRLAILADGMGGYSAGEVASCKAVEVVCDQLEQGETMRKAIEQANKDVYTLAQQNEAYQGMGTTLIASHFGQNSVTVAHVGDSRLYRLRGDELKQLTIDQTLAQQMLEQDIEYHDGKHFSAFEHVLINALGVGVDMSITIIEEDLEAGDVYLLCSDGLSGVMSNDQIAQIMQDQSGALDALLQALLDAALKTTAPDNISMAAIRCA